MANIAAKDHSISRLRFPLGKGSKLALGAALSFAGLTVLLGHSNPNTALPPLFTTPREVLTEDPVENVKSIRVVSWNVDRGTQLGLVSDELQRNPADLCLLQEVDWNTARTGNQDVAARLAKELHLNMSYGVEFEELGQEHDHDHPAYIGQATLTKLPIRRTRILRFERQSGFWKPHSWLPSSVGVLQRRLGDRMALVTDLTFGSGLLVVYNVHLESRSAGPIQAKQLDEILADMQSYPPKTAFILAGDLNTKYFPSIFLHKLERAGFESALGKHIERTHELMMALDWIFAKGPISVRRGAVRRDLHGSDHFPVYADLVAQ